MVVRLVPNAGVVVRRQVDDILICVFEGGSIGVINQCVLKCLDLSFTETGHFGVKFSICIS